MSEVVDSFSLLLGKAISSEMPYEKYVDIDSDFYF